MKLARAVTTVLAGTLVAGAVIATPAAATPGSGVTSRTIAQMTLGHDDYVLRELTLAPGGTTGWHSHPDTVRAVIRAGALTHMAADCTTVHVYRAGQVLVERPGSVHIGRNEGSTPVVLDVLYIKPTGTPLSRDAPKPACAAQ